jgi:rod shape-determining protein MreC
MYSSVRLISDPTQHIPVKNSRNGIRGITKGLASNDSGMVLKYIPLQSDIKLGDIFMTSGIGNYYPSGYAVGRVRSIDENQDPSFMTLYLEPTQNMNRLELVLIVKENND